MVKFGKQVVKHRVAILIASILLLIPSVFGYFHTRVNYDVLTYLPKDIETMQGQDIMLEDFDIGAFSMFMVDGMEDKDVAALKSKIEQVDHVKNVLWYDSIADISVPRSTHRWASPFQTVPSYLLRLWTFRLRNIASRKYAESL